MDRLTYTANDMWRRAKQEEAQRQAAEVDEARRVERMLQFQRQVDEIRRREEQKADEIRRRDVEDPGWREREAKAKVQALVQEAAPRQKASAPATTTPTGSETCHLDSGMPIAVTQQLAIEVHNGFRAGDRANLVAIIRGHGAVVVPVAAAARVVDSGYLYAYPDGAAWIVDRGGGYSRVRTNSVPLTIWHVRVLEGPLIGREGYILPSLCRVTRLAPTQTPPPPTDSPAPSRPRLPEPPRIQPPAPPSPNDRLTKPSTAPVTSPSHPVTPTPGPSLSTTNERYMVIQHFGCRDSGIYQRVVSYVAQGHVEAGTRLLAAETLRGQCLQFEAGERVYLADVGISSGLVKIRKPGNPLEVWTGIRMIRQ